MRNVFHVLDLAVKCNASELLKQSSVLILRNFSRIHDKIEMLNLTLNKVQILLSDREWQGPQEAVLNFICNWVNYHVAAREDHFISLLQYVNWGHVSVSFISDHIDKHLLYQTSADAMFTILHVVLDRQGIVLGPKYQTAYQNLQEKLLPDQELDELNDSNSFLSIAINSAVKDLEQSEVDPDWFLQGSETAGPSGVVVPPGGPSPSSMQLARQDGSSATSAAAAQLSSVDLEIAEQVISEQQLSEEKNYKYSGGSRDVNAVKRYDPKYRALTEAFRQMEEEEEGNDVDPENEVAISENAIATQASAVSPAVKTPSTKEHGLGYYKYPSYTPMGFRPQSEQEVANSSSQGQSGYIHVGSKNSSQEAQNWHQDPATVQVSTGFSTPPLPIRSVSNTPSLQGQYILPDADYGQSHHGPVCQEDLHNSDRKDKQVQSGTEGSTDEIFSISAGRATNCEESLVTPKKTSPLPLVTPTKKRHFCSLADDYEDARVDSDAIKNKIVASQQNGSQKQHLKKAKLLAEHRSLKPTEQPLHKEEPEGSAAEAPTDDKTTPCPFCDHRCHSLKQLRGHVRSDHAVLKAPYRCPDCEFSGERLHLLIAHRAEKHGPARTKEGGACVVADDDKESENVAAGAAVATNTAAAAANVSGCDEEESKYSELCCAVRGCGFVGKSKSKLDLHTKLHGRRHSCKECKVGRRRTWFYSRSTVFILSWELA